MALRDRLIAQITAGGPMSVAQYMTACLHDPKEGYYATRPALGAAGDFVTAPLVSQMFGELISLWLVEVWSQLGRPSTFRLVEIGPGDGTLMSDIQRAAALVPEFLVAQDLWLVETSEPLRGRQRAQLGPSPQWVATLGEVPTGAPILLVANELLDCLPARQFVRGAAGWTERGVGIDSSGALAFGGMGAMPAGLFPDAAPGAIWEQSAGQEALAYEIGARIERDGGAALLIDYGRGRPGFGDTLQALAGHKKVSPLAHPGEADLTMHVDFPAVLAAARRAGAEAAPLQTQGDFLVRLGIGARAEALAGARPDQASRIEAQLERLISPDQMGELFKVACLHQPGLAPPGFEEC